MDDTTLCWSMLPSVSRSFALCIKILPKPLNEQMMVSYLIFRTIDTIEDSSAPLEVKRALFEKYLSALRGRGMDAASVAAAKAELLSKASYTYEKVLLENADAVARAYFSQPAQVRGAILKRARTMARGMYEFQKKRIETFADQNRYSYYVAGVIGYLFNDLLHFNGIISKALKRRLRRYARHFGLALQKVNILRDIAADLSSSRRYWPSELLEKYKLTYESLCLKENREIAMKILREHVKNARNYLVSAMKYVLLLPKKALQVRMFCLIPLFMAIESYAKCAQSAEVFDSGAVVKISRKQVHEIVAKSGMWGSSNERLTDWFFLAMRKASPEFEREYARFFAAPA